MRSLRCLDQRQSGNSGTSSSLHELGGIKHTGPAVPLSPDRPSADRSTDPGTDPIERVRDGLSGRSR